MTAAVMLVVIASMIAVATLTSTLVVISWLDIDSLLHDPVTFWLVCLNNPAFRLLGLVFIGEAKQHKAETTASLSKAIAHYDRIFNFAEFLEIVLKVLLWSRKGKPSNE